MTIRQFRAASFATLFLVLASGCGEQEEGDRCETNADCASGLLCVDVNDVDLCCPQTGATVDACVGMGLISTNNGGAAGSSAAPAGGTSSGGADASAAVDSGSAAVDATSSDTGTSADSAAE